MTANNAGVNTLLGAQQQTLTKLLFTENPRRVLLGNLRGFKSIKNSTEHKNNTFASCAGSLNPVGSLNLPELGTPLLQGKPSPDLTFISFCAGFNELPRRVLLGNWVAGFRSSTAIIVLAEPVEEHV